MTCRWLLPAVTSLLATACTAGDSTSQASIVQDSAGVRIAENPPDVAGEEWRLATPAVLQIGRSVGRPGPDLFGSIRQAILLSTGDIAVADGLAAEIRVFDEGGGHLLTFGGRGEGPGEFRNLLTIAELTGDTIAAVDPPGGRVSLFTFAGTFTRSFPIPRIPGASFPNVIGWLEDGPLLIQALTRSPSRDTRDQSTHFSTLPIVTARPWLHWANSRAAGWAATAMASASAGARCSQRAAPWPGMGIRAVSN